MTPDPTSMPQELAGRYQPQRLLGEGGMARVYEVYDSLLGRNVALKQLRPALAVDAEERERFLREARMAAGLSHPGVARVYDVGDEASGPFLVQELVEGQGLDQALPLPAEQALAVTAQLGEALDFIHRQGIVHCDIKPQNVMLTPDGRAVLLDFGVAEPPGLPVPRLFGTPQYLAPERAQGLPPTPASDVYALGVMLYELLTGAVPIDGPSVQEILQRHVKQGVPPLRQAAPGLAPALEPLLLRATAREPDQRLSMAELAAELRSLLQLASRSTTVVPQVAQRGTVPIHNMPTSVVAVPGRQPKAAAAVAAPPAAPRPVGAPTPVPPSAGYSAPPLAPTSASQGLGRRAPLLVLGALLGLAALFLLLRGGDDSAAGTSPAGGSQALAAVPELTGLTVDQATAKLDPLALTLEVSREDPADQPPGTIISQDPLAGSQVAEGEQVRVVLSSGPAAPPVEAQPQPEAEEQEEEEGKGNGKGKDKGKGKGKKDN